MQSQIQERAACFGLRISGFHGVHWSESHVLFVQFHMSGLKVNGHLLLDLLSLLAREVALRLRHRSAHRLVHLLEKART